MCGIIGILGTHEVAPSLVEALKRLEYRGYDSAGIATLQNGALDRRRALGKLVNLSDHLVHNPLPGHIGIGHTRWATHGAPTETNAHPHRSGGVAVVHNGIIENFKELRDELAARNFGCESDTDTEVVAVLCNSYLAEGMDPIAAAKATVARLTGAFALAFLFDGHDDLIVGARLGSPLAIGHGDGEMYLGSDAIALGPMTDRITYLEEGDIAVLTRAGATITDASGAAVTRPEQTIRMDQAQIDKAGHKHFMRKEIAEQSTVLADGIAHYIRDGAVTLPPELDFTAIDRITLVGCGSAHISCLVAKYWFESIARIPVEVDVASEFRYREPPLPERTLAMFVSQSGETADTLAALRYAKGRAQVAALVNVDTSTIAREADVALPIMAGVEISVASTKAVTCQMSALLMIALKAAHVKGALTDAAYAEALAQMTTLPGLIAAAIGIEPMVADLAQTLSEARDVLFLGRGALYPVALEGALKLKELSYIHAEGYASGELKHGPIALIDSHMPVIVLAPSDALFDKTVSNMQEVMARDGQVTLVSDAKGVQSGGDGVAHKVRMPDAPDMLAPIVYTVPAQLISYHTALAKGTDVDQPRNLAKSVTVE